METFKKYLPLIVIGIIGFFAIRKLSSGGQQSAPIRNVIPLTPSREPSYTDPLLPFRAGAFGQLAEIARAQIEGDTARDLAKQARETESLRITAGIEQSRLANDIRSILGLRELDVREILGLSGEETERDTSRTQSDLAKALQAMEITQQQFLQNSFLRQLELFYQSREQDRQLQQSAIDRVNRQQSTGGILGSINAAIQGIFNPQNKNVFGTPTTFPSGIDFPKSFGIF